MKRLLLLVTLGVSVSLGMIACNGDVADSDGDAGETGSGGKGSGGKGSGGKGSGGNKPGTGGAATGGVGGGAPSGGAATGGDAGAATGGDAGAATGGMGGGDGGELESLCQARCQVTIQLECPGWEDLSACTETCVYNDSLASGCSAEYQANVQCESTDDLDGFQCVEPFPGAGFYFVAQSADTACDDTYNEYVDCAL